MIPMLSSNLNFFHYISKSEDRGKIRQPKLSSLRQKPWKLSKAPCQSISSCKLAPLCLSTYKQWITDKR